MTARLEAYERQTAPILPHYRRLGHLYAVDGMADMEEVARQIEAVLLRLPVHGARVVAMS